MNTIIDSHCHIYPEKIASKASVAIGEFYGIPMAYDGTIENLIAEGKAAGVTRFLVHSVATTVKQVGSINDFILEQSVRHADFIPFMTLHPDMSKAEIASEVEKRIENGIYGIKLHPDFQMFKADGEACFNIAEVAEGRLPILFHAGDKRYDYSSPQRIANLARNFPRLTVIAAHFGGYSDWQSTDAYEGLENVYFDTSSTLAFLPSEDAARLIHRFGADRFLFGTDYPMWRADDEIKRVKALKLGADAEEMIFHVNAERVLKLTK